MSNALHDYAKLFERYAANNGGTGAILAGEDCLALANEMRMDADAIDAENTKLRELLQRLLMEYRYISVRPRKVYMRHEERMRAIEEEMRELGMEGMEVDV